MDLKYDVVPGKYGPETRFGRAPGPRTKSQERAWCLIVIREEAQDGSWRRYMDATRCLEALEAGIDERMVDRLAAEIADAWSPTPSGAGGEWYVAQRARQEARNEIWAQTV